MMNTDELLDTIDGSEYLNTEQIMAVLEHAISLCGNHPVSGLLAALSQRMAIDDILYQKTIGEDQHAIHH